LYRYSAVRRQFGPPGKDEIPVLEYQMQVGGGIYLSFFTVKTGSNKKFDSKYKVVVNR
jgi:hypothetical protein